MFRLDAALGGISKIGASPGLNGYKKENPVNFLKSRHSQTYVYLARRGTQAAALVQDREPIDCGLAPNFRPGPKTRAVYPPGSA